MPDDPSKLVSTVQAPVILHVIGTEASGAPSSGTIIKTLGVTSPDFRVKRVNPLVAVAIRFGYQFCTALGGALAAGNLTNTVEHHSGATLLYAAFVLALFTAGVGAVKDFATVLSGLESRYPLSSGSV